MLERMPKASNNTTTNAAASEPEMRIFEPLCAVFRRALKHEGLKYTPERARILDTVIGLDRAFDADELIAELRKAAARSGTRVSQATVYRPLKLLADSGIVQQVPVDADQAVYQLAYGQQPTALVVIASSGESQRVDVPELEVIAKRLCAQRGLVWHGQRFVIYAEPTP